MSADSNRNCVSIEPSLAPNLYLVRQLEDTISAWLYLLVDTQKMPVFLALTKFLPLKIDVSDYGQIIKSGEGDNPPDNIRAQMNMVDFVNNAATPSSQIFYLICHDANHEHFYVYLDVPYYLHNQFIAKKDQKGSFELTEYGEILHSDWGDASEEVRAMMKEKYGIDTPN